MKCCVSGILTVTYKTPQTKNYTQTKGINQQNDYESASQEITSRSTISIAFCRSMVAYKQNKSPRRFTQIRIYRTAYNDI